MTSSEKRKRVKAYILSREGKNQYTQSVKRTLVDEGWSDCSSLQQRAYQEIDMNIGSYTGAQIAKGRWVQLGGEYPDESLLKIGDELFFSANYDNGRSYRVNHIEMYVGNGQISGHGSGIGPVRKNMVEYCKQRNTVGRNYIGVKRYIESDEAAEIIPGAENVMFVGECTGNGVNVRKGPHISYENIENWPRLNKGNLVDVLEQIGSWYKIRIAGEYKGYISLSYIKKHREPELEMDNMLNRVPKWTGRISASLLNVRAWAGTEYPKIKSWPQLASGNLVDVCDTVKAINGSDWYYIRIDGSIYGFVSAAYVEPV